MSIPPPPPRRRTPSPAPSPPPPNQETRAARRTESRSSGRGRPPFLLIAAVVVAVALIAVGVVVAGGGKDSPPVDATTSVDLQLGDITVEAVNPLKDTAEAFPTETADAALALVESYVHEATVVPLRSGVAKSAALAKLFDDAAIARLGVADREQVLDEGLPKAIGKVTVNGAPVALTALIDDTGTIVLLSATVDLDITSQAKKGVITITRTGTLVLMPQLDATWKITGWTLHVERGGPGVVPTPTSSTTPTSTAVAP